MGRTLHQLVATVAPHDAVTGQALAWRERFRTWGLGGDIYAENIHPDMRGTVRPLDELHDDGAPVLLRYSIWSGAADRALRLPRGRLCLWYHNITPPAYLAPVNPAVAALCARGRRALPSAVRAAGVVVADSRFNADELHGLGASDVAVVPLLLDIGAVQEPRPSHRHPVVLTVGRVVPNKRIEDAIRAIAALRRRLVSDARLVVVGPTDGFEAYHAALERFAAQLGMADAVTFTGRIDDAARDRWYRDADAYLCTSEHEGFCAPLVEALAAGLPVVARAAGAVPETLGTAGVVLPGSDPWLVAEALARVLADDEVRRGLGHNARRRLTELRPERVDAACRAALEPLLT